MRRCVFREDVEASQDALDRRAVHERLDLEGLRKRPTDAAELSHAITRRAERLRADGHPAEAFGALREVPYLLEPLLAIRRSDADPPAEDLFGAEQVQINAQHSFRARGLRNREVQGRPFN